jgi:hypothetical protein
MSIPKAICLAKACSGRVFIGCKLRATGQVVDYGLGGCDMTGRPAGAHGDLMMGGKRALAKLKAGVCAEGFTIFVRTGRWMIGMIVKWQGSCRAFCQLFLCLPRGLPATADRKCTEEIATDPAGRQSAL